MKETSYFNQAVSLVFNSLKTAWLFGFVSMTTWVILLTVWADGVYLYYWDIFDSIAIFSICAVIYILMIILGTTGASLILVFLKRGISNLFTILMGSLFGMLATILSTTTIWFFFYSKGRSYAVYELIFHPLFILPNIITIMLLIYSNWKMNKLSISLSVLPRQE